MHAWESLTKYDFFLSIIFMSKLKIKNYGSYYYFLFLFFIQDKNFSLT